MLDARRNDPPPVIGACLPVEALAEHRDWLFDMDRDLELQTFHLAETLDGDWQALADEAARTLDGFKGRLGIHGPFWGFTVDSLDPEIRAVVTRRMMQGLDVCARTGANLMVIHSPYSQWTAQNLPNIDGAREKLAEMVRLTLDPVVRRAEDQGVVLAMENIQDVDPADRRLLCEAFDSPALKLSIDTGHAQFAHVSNGAPPVDYYIRDAGAALAHVHLQDADGYADRHWSLGEGTIRWRAVFDALAEIEAAPRLVLELRDRARIPEAMGFLEAEGLGR